MSCPEVTVPHCIHRGIWWKRSFEHRLSKYDFSKLKMCKGKVGIDHPDPDHRFGRVREIKRNLKMIASLFWSQDLEIADPQDHVCHPHKVLMMDRFGPCQPITQLGKAAVIAAGV